MSDEFQHLDEDLQRVEERLLRVRPARMPLPYEEGLMNLSRAGGRSRQTWAVWALAASFAFASLVGWMSLEHAPDEAQRAAVDPTNGGMAVADVLEMTDVLNAEEAGTAPATDGIYRIMKVTLVHRTLEVSEGAVDARVISERTSHQFVALPLEIF